LLETPEQAVSISYYDDYQQACFGISIQHFSKEKMVWRIDAEKMNYDTIASKWKFQNAMIRSFPKGNESFKNFPSVDSIELSFTPQDLKESSGASVELMTIPEHREFLKQKAKGGFDSVDEFVVKYHTKISFPFACLIVILIGVPLSAQKKRTGIAIEAGICLLVGFIYIGVQQVFSTLGYKGEVNPIVAAWMPNLLFLLIGLGMLFKAQK
jgi:lipopolysaccharide export system permease protein